MRRPRPGLFAGFSACIAIVIVADLARGHGDRAAVHALMLFTTVALWFAMWKPKRDAPDRPLYSFIEDD
jgi:hypothetical protein